MFSISQVVGVIKGQCEYVNELFESVQCDAVRSDKVCDLIRSLIRWKVDSIFEFGLLVGLVGSLETEFHNERAENLEIT